VLFVNLPLQYAAASPRYLERFLGPLQPWPSGFHFAPELGLDALSMQRQPREWHERLSQRLRDAGLVPSLHLPFFELSPGAFDEYVREASIQRLTEALGIAKVYAPAHMVAHPRYDQTIHGPDKELWLQNSLASWRRILDVWDGHPPLYLENTHETSPELLVALVRALQPRNVRICFDIGHWHSFAGGARRDNLDAWLDAVGPLLGHLHLHDNDGADDQHLGLGRGSIPWEEFFALLTARGLKPGATFEPHTEEAMASTLAFMQAHRPLFSRFQPAA
jgi:sugar phosphate isomerase/epimerase